MDTSVLKHYRLSLEEYQTICRLLDHTPSRLELVLFSALWSEHCSYKSSILHLKKLHFDSPAVVKGFGENAGVVDLGEGEKVAFKVESHNHPSMITPYYGASTGVGGILRDIFVMNARPVVLANYLCFGNNRGHSLTGLVDGVVRGISDYGNCIGIPNVTGQTEFHSDYDKNVVVNALALGYFGPEDLVMTSQASGAGNLFVYVGSRTGRDGIHGASMASESFNKDTENKKDCVQIGDPFYGKLLMEACLEVMKKNLVVAAQDMGAAGLISSSFEMVSKAKMGMNLYLDRVPLRDNTMKAEDILLSETQERVLLLVQPDNWKKVKSIFEKWSLPVCVIGEVTQDTQVKLFWKKKCLVEINPLLLTEKAPRYSRSYELWKPEYYTKDRNQTQSILLNSTKGVSSLNKSFLSKTESCLLSVLQDSRACSRRFIFQQYDQTVGAKTIKDCSFSFGVIRLPHSGRALGVCLGGRPYMMRMDCREGGKDSVIEPALQLAARGFLPLALTDGLNFGSPENKEVMTQFVACIEGIASASRSLNIPVVSGNVSLYNESEQNSISPTPVIAVTGIKDSLDIPPDSIGPVNEECDVYLLSGHQLFSKGYFGEYQKEPPLFHGSLNVEVCRQMIQILKKCSLLFPPSAVYVVGKFGLAYALARLVLHSQTGIKINTSYPYFQERLYEVVLVLNEEKATDWKKQLSEMQNTPDSTITDTTAKTNNVQERCVTTAKTSNVRERYVTTAKTNNVQERCVTTAKTNNIQERCVTTEKKLTNFKLEKIGKLIQEPYLYFNDDVSLSVDRLNEAYEMGWNQNFKN